MRTLDELSREYEEHCRRPFPPGCRGVEEPADLVTLDSYTAGCISTFLGNRGLLDSERLTILTECGRLLRSAVEALAGQEREYFLKLAELTIEVLEFLRERDEDA